MKGLTKRCSQPLAVPIGIIAVLHETAPIACSNAYKLRNSLAGFGRFRTYLVRLSGWASVLKTILAKSSVPGGAKSK